VTPDPNFDCTDIIGKVFDDANANGYPIPVKTDCPACAS
jgi:hypothetical protein